MPPNTKVVITFMPAARQKRRTVVAVSVAVVGALAGCQSVYVSPTGSDSGSCTIKQPCRTFARAYQAAAQQKLDHVLVRRGSYPRQTVPSGSRRVTFKAESGTKLRGLESSASSVTFDGFDIDGAFTKQLAFHSNGDSATFRNGRIGNVTDEKGALVSGRNFTFDNVVFHDVRSTNPSIHNECLYAIGVPGITVRRSLFHHCATMDAFFTYGDWWSPLPPAYGKVTLENNVFAHTYKDDGSWHYYSLYVANTANGGGTLDGWTVRNNTFEIPANIEHGATGGSRWVSNLGNWNCVRGMRYSHNVGTRCAATDKQVTPAASSAARTAPFGWVNPAANDFRLNAGSPAVNAGDPSDRVSTDRVSKARVGAPDAGALER